MEPKPKLKRDWIGRKVKTVQELRNREVSIPAGTVMTVATNSGGLGLWAPACPHCGMRPYIHGVQESCVELLPKEQSHE